MRSGLLLDVARRAAVVAPCGRAPVRGRAPSWRATRTVVSASQMDAALLSTVEDVHKTPTKVCLAVTGGASQSLGWTLGVPGASNTVLEAIVPYAKEATEEFIGHEPEKFVSAETAAAMATAAYRRALRLAPPGTDVAGVAATCSLASVPLKRGDHRCVVATQSAWGTRQYSVTFSKGKRQRFEEDATASRLVVSALAEVCGVADPQRPLRGHLDEAAGEAVHTEAQEVGDPISALLERRTAVVELRGGRAVAVGATRARVLLSGSFNPLHDGHKMLLQQASAACGGAPAAFELSVTNADKGQLPREEVDKRAKQFVQDDGTSFVLTDAPLFVMKAKVLPGTTFVVGVDTAVRIVMPKYYGGSQEAMIEILETIRRCGCSFLVAGRVMEGEYRTIRAVQPPAGYEGLFRELPGFRVDISSTELRKKALEAGV